MNNEKPIKSLYIIIDGIDGCGKTTQCSLLNNYFMKDRRYDHILTLREPTNGEYGSMFRNILEKSIYTKQIAEKCLEYLFKDRIYNIENYVIPFLSTPSGKSTHVIIQRRGKYSTVAYEGSKWINYTSIILMHEKNEIMQKAIPDFVFIIDVEIKKALKRMEKNGKKSIFKDKELLEKICKHFRNMPEYFSNEKILVLDGNNNIESVNKEIVEHIERYINS